MNALGVIFWGVVTFSILVVIHEGGHFLAARIFKVKVHEFMIGLPGPAIRYHGKKNDFGITALPLGGYVRIAGMEPGAEDELLPEALWVVTSAGGASIAGLADALRVDNDRAGALLSTLADWAAVKPAEDDDISYVAAMQRQPGESQEELYQRARGITYKGLPTWKRIVTLSMGVAMNLLAAILTFTLVLSIWGYSTPTSGIASVEKGSAAAAAGIKAGDEIVGVNGKTAKGWDELITAISAAKPGDTIRLTLKRDGRQVEVSAKLGSRDGAPFLGVGSKTVHVRPSPWKALVMSLTLTGLVFQAILRFFSPATFRQSLGMSSGVIGIAYRADEAVRNGALDYAAFVALLSLSLGAMNILPIPPLDGGKVVMELVERIAGRPLKRQVTVGITVAGALLLFTLIGYLMYADVVRFIVKG